MSFKIFRQVFKDLFLVYNAIRGCEPVHHQCVHKKISTQKLHLFVHQLIFQNLNIRIHENFNHKNQISLLLAIPDTNAKATHSRFHKVDKWKMRINLRWYSSRNTKKCYRRNDTNKLIPFGKIKHWPLVRKDDCNTQLMHFVLTWFKCFKLRSSTRKILLITQN